MLFPRMELYVDSNEENRRYRMWALMMRVMGLVLHEWLRLWRSRFIIRPANS